MAFHEVSDDDALTGGVEWKQLKAVGAKIEGLVVGYEAREREYEGKSSTRNTYEFDGPHGGRFKIDAPRQLHAKLQRARKDGLTKGGLVIAVVTGTKDVGRPEPMKLIKVQWSMDAADIKAWTAAQKRHPEKASGAKSQPAPAVVPAKTEPGSSDADDHSPLELAVDDDMPF